MGGNKWWYPTVSGVIGGVCCVYAGQPFDTIKVRLQTQHMSTQAAAFKGPLDVVKHVLRTEGPLSLYRGATPALISVITENAVLFTANNLIKNTFAYFNPNTTDLTLAQHALAGGLSGVFSSTAICPAEVVKCTVQAQTAMLQQKAVAALAAPISAQTAVATAPTSLAVAKPSPLSVARHIVKTEGFRGFFKGLPSLWARDIPFNFAFLGSYEAYMALIGWQQGASRDDLGFSSVFVAGGLAGMTGWSVVFPFDSIKSRVQTAPKGVSNLSVGMTILRQEGVRGFYRGWSAAVMRAFPANAALLFGFELCHRMFNAE